ncbi:MAG: T9SS type A sorting domain-containing protein [Lewinellaceae bacterium]|nr:T9SS type A sorting domain-containing protein [Saprospiraceae bacterium]MCB9331167.1 T9SS type A sorting domain-containing protein [Lewinellaceae bacterium]
MKKSICIIAAYLLAAAHLAAQSFIPGTTYGGGVIIYIEPGGTWGLVAAKDQITTPAGFTWAEADSVCRNLAFLKKGDWFLPSRAEAAYIATWTSAGVLNGTDPMWTSTESDAANAWIRNFFVNQAPEQPWPKNNRALGAFEMAVRPVRRFFVPLTMDGEPACRPTNLSDFVPGPAMITYGSGIDMANNSRRTNVVVGQAVVGISNDGSMTNGFGSGGELLLPPAPPIITASQGELLDRIQISWAPNTFGAQASNGYKLYREGIFLASFDTKVRNYNDFNVIAGRPYIYSITGINSYGEGTPGKALGYQVPNGVVTGYIQTQNGRPVVDATVTLMPMQGFSLLLGPNDRAFAEDSTGFLFNADNWTLTGWAQVDQVTDFNTKLFQFEGADWWLSPRADSGKKGVILNVQGSPTGIQLDFPDSTQNAWHHFAVSHDGTQFRGYIDGKLVGSITAPAVSGDTKTLNLGGDDAQWSGRIDELRIYHKKLDELDFGEIMEGTASSLTPGLKYYWKMDEAVGTRSFDIIGRNLLTFCGPVFDDSRPPVRTAGKTNEDGFYRIESVSYGTGTTFMAEPMKLFYMHRALKFVRAENDYALLPDFGLTDSASLQTATLELWANSAGPDGTQCLLSKKWGSNEFRLELEQVLTSNLLNMTVGGQQQSFGIVGQGYQHLAFQLQQTGSTLRVDGFANGATLGTRFFTLPAAGNWSDSTQNWVLGARLNGTTPTDFFGGLIDEVAVYDTLLTVTEILDHKNAARDPKGKHLRVYFALDEGAGNRLNNSGAKLLGAGQTSGTEWSAFTAIQETEPHVFSPKTRQVTLNPSVTSVDQVDFTDRSTVPVSGFVRYANTDCFANKVEILVNGASYSPAVYTDSTGQFVIDLDPGATVTLSPKFEDHSFIPAFWEITNISSPIAGVLFNDMTTRTVSGVVAGGTCKKSIIRTNQPNPANNTICKVNIRSKDGCYDKTLTVNDSDGEYEFADLPPMEMTVAIEEHSEPDIETYFQNKGGASLDLGKRDTIIDFIYFAPPAIQILSGLDTLPPCSRIVLEKGQEVTVEIGLAEDYYGELCPVDSASFRLLNGFAGINLDTVMRGGVLVYTFTAGDPNPAPPFLQTLQIIATTLSGNEVSRTEQAVVTGQRSKESTFTTAMPATPSLILRDPPGDGSYAFLEKGEKTCQNVTMNLEYEVGGVAGLQLSFAPEFALIVTSFGFGVSIPEETINTITAEAQVTYQKLTDTSFQTCTSFNRRISTSEDDLAVGGAQGGDVFVGSGMNVKFGFVDVVNFNPATCEAMTETALSVEPGGFHTTFVYSEFNIRNNIIRYLDELALHTTNPDSIAYYQQSSNRWKEILAYNDSLKAQAPFKENLSFDAGAVYEYSTTIDTVLAGVTTTALNSEGSLVGEAGFEIGGVGITTKLGFLYSTSKGQSTEYGTEKGVTTGFVLKDNDPGDLFTVDVAEDPVYKTPVFRTKTGQSSCPWEQGTAHREGVLLSMRDGSGPVATDVPANEPAVFKFTLGNVSATNETFTYAFTAGPESNPDGAVIKLNGAVLDHAVYYAIPFGESVPITVTVERGPEAFDYDSLEIVLYSECEDARANALGILPDDDTITYSAIYISAHFIKPCSEVEISKPEQDWVLSADSGPDPSLMNIRLSDYDRDDPDLGVMRLQYRSPDGSWINIGDDIPKADLGATFYNYTWNTAGLPDGPYEIRGLAICTSGDATDKPGYSHVIKGRIERLPPTVSGVPEPADGVLNVGDEISVTFNKHLDCSKIFKADLTDPRNVGLYNTETNSLIDFDLYCLDNKIELVPTFQNQYFENKVLRLELHNIPDKIGNKLTAYNWEFYVDRNELAWLTDSIGMTKNADEIKTVTAAIHNRGGSPVPFSITNVPDWVRVVPDRGTLVPNEIRNISFEVDSTVAFGHWSDTITLHTETGQNPFFMGGDESLPIGVRVVCRPPDWQLDAGIYPVTMNMVVELNIQGTSSADPEDIVAAFINGELRGRAKLQYYPSVNKYLAHLTIYGESAEVSSPIEIQIWDASACLRYASVQESFTFQPDNVLGTPVNPVVLHTNSYVQRDIPFNNGWNWVSFNLAFPDPALDPALASLNHPDNDLLKAQNTFSLYSGGWFGSLTSLANTTMYQYRADQRDTLHMVGNVIDPTAVNIPLSSGWNWLGYLPNYALEVNAALGSLSPVTGDLIKSQFGFSQYIGGFGWIGNLKYMFAPQGYQLRLTNPGSLTYPPGPQFRPDASEARGESGVTGYWTVDPSNFEHSMTLVGMLESNGQNLTMPDFELGAFAGNEVRGTTSALYVEPLQGYLFFLTMYANTSGEQLLFKLYDAATGQISPLSETMFFAADLHQGSIEAPVPFTRTITGQEEVASVQSFEIQPNPFSGEALLQFGAAHDQQVQITVNDLEGREIQRLRIDARQGLNTYLWQPKIPAGLYIIRLQTAEGAAVRKVIRE